MTTATKLNSDLNDRNAIEDLKAIADTGIESKRIVQCNSNTLNTPYKEGLTSASAGTAYINMSSPNHGTIVYVSSAEPEIYLLYKNSAGWQNWVKVTTNTDLAGRLNFSASATALQTPFQENIAFRLQINGGTGEAVIYQTIDGGDNWKRFKVLG